MRVRYLFSSKKTGKSRKPFSVNSHKQEFPKLVREVIRTADIILEILDSRFVSKTRNPELEEYILSQDKKIIYILNKADLVDVNALKENPETFELNPKIIISCKDKIGRTNLRTFLKIEAKRLHLPKGKKARIGVVGYPNTGKSSIINILASGRGVGVGGAAGFTRGIQKIRFSKDILVLDTPGVIPDKEDFNINAWSFKKHAEIGVKTFDKVDSPDLVVMQLMKNNPGLFELFYNIDADGDVEILLDKLGRRLGFVKKGNEVDTDRAARFVLKDWQSGKIRK